MAVSQRRRHSQDPHCRLTVTTAQPEPPVAVSGMNDSSAASSEALQATVCACSRPAQSPFSTARARVVWEGQEFSLLS